MSRHSQEHTSRRLLKKSVPGLFPLDSRKAWFSPAPEFMPFYKSHKFAAPSMARFGNNLHVVRPCLHKARSGCLLQQPYPDAGFITGHCPAGLSPGIARLGAGSSCFSPGTTPVVAIQCNTRAEKRQDNEAVDKQPRPAPWMARRSYGFSKAVTSETGENHAFRPSSGKSPGTGFFRSPKMSRFNRRKPPRGSDDPAHAHRPGFG